MRKLFFVLTTSLISLLSSCVNSAKSESDKVSISVPNDTIIKEAKEDSLILAKPIIGDDNKNASRHYSHAAHGSHVSHFSRLD